MTERRSINTAPKSWSSIEDGICGGSSWCNDNNTSRQRNAGAGVSRMKRFHLALYLLAAFALYHLISKAPAMSNVEGASQVAKTNETESINPFIDNDIFGVAESELPPSYSDFDEKGGEAITEGTHSHTSESATHHVDEPNRTSTDVITDDDTGDGTQNLIDTSVTKNSWGNSSNNETLVNSNKWPSKWSNKWADENTQPKENIFKAENDTNTSIYVKNETDDKPYWKWKNKTQPINTSSSSPPQKSSDPTEEQTKNSTTTNNVTTTSASDQFHNPISDSELSPVALNFAEMHCDLTNLKDGSWYPSGPEDDWQQRAPYVIVAGVWNGGVNPLATALLRHPQIDAAKQNDFFLPRNFDGRFSITTTDKNANTNNQTTIGSTETNFNVKVFPARERMYASHYSKLTLRDSTVNNEEESTLTTVVAGENDENNNSKILHVAMDVSPGLIYHAHETSHWILCTAPWVKIVILLRNPVERLYRQWSYSVTHLNLKLSLEDWMAPEMKLMQSLGLIEGGKEPSSDEDDPEMVVSEREAWQNYKATRNTVGAIGRSLYVLQLEELIETYISAGKTPSEEIIILTTEKIEDNAEQEYAELIQFLGLTPYDDTPKIIGNTTIDSASSVLEKGLAEGTGTEPMSEETRTMLVQFFKPYNRRLTKLLTSNGFEGNWHRLWKF